MRKTKVEITCDDCGQSLKEEDVIQISCLGDNIDFCKSCVSARVKHSLTIVELNRVCRKCNGCGKVKEGFGQNNDHTFTTCDVCKGSKVTPLSEIEIPF